MVQLNYAATQRPAVAGMVADMTEWDAITRIVQTAPIPFGRAVSAAVGNVKGAVLGGASAAVFLGISIRDTSLEVNANDQYPVGANMGVLTEGHIWVVTGGAVQAGEDVTFAQATGILSSAAGGAAQFAVTGARWMTNAASGELAIVRLSGHLPATT